jgi:hypothetical protein
MHYRSPHDCNKEQFLINGLCNNCVLFAGRIEIRSHIPPPKNTYATNVTVHANESDIATFAKENPKFRLIKQVITISRSATNKKIAINWAASRVITDHQSSYATGIPHEQEQ